MKDPSAILTTYFRSQTSNFHKRATLFCLEGLAFLAENLYTVYLISLFETIFQTIMR